jgi:predicted Fe-Mo cluster-binding NifX family protein
MKIALPARQNMIDDHFGHCEQFAVYTIDDNKKVLSVENVPSPNGCGCKSNIASVLAGMGVSILLAGNMGEGAVNVLRNSNISVVRGCSGETNQVVADWLAGKVKDNFSVCHKHEHGCKH